MLLQSGASTGKSQGTGISTVMEGLAGGRGWVGRVAEPKPGRMAGIAVCPLEQLWHQLSAHSLPCSASHGHLGKESARAELLKHPGPGVLETPSERAYFTPNNSSGVTL